MQNMVFRISIALQTAQAYMQMASPEVENMEVHQSLDQSPVDDALQPTIDSA
jgi:hypothetical protein